MAHALQEPLRLELEKLVDEGILCKLKIDEKSEWLNSFVCVRKPNGSIRLCLDPTHLNRYIVHPHQNSKTLDDILPKLAGAKKFSIVDSTKVNQPAMINFVDIPSLYNLIKTLNSDQNLKFLFLELTTLCLINHHNFSKNFNHFKEFSNFTYLP